MSDKQKENAPETELQKEIERLEQIIHNQTYENWELQKTIKTLRVELIKLKLKHGDSLSNDEQKFVIENLGVVK